MTTALGARGKRLISSEQGFIVSLLSVVLLAGTGPAWGQPRVSSLPLIETFKNAAPDNRRWILGGFNNSSGPDPAFLTSGNADPSGNGWLRMTQLENQPVFLANSYAYYDVPFALGPGLLVSFDFASWGGSGADGISFYLFDGATRNFVPGVGAGALEYAPDGACTLPGLSNAYVGIGFDDFGNFSGLGCPGSGPGAIPNSIAIRGSGNDVTGYDYLTGTSTLPQTLDFRRATERPNQLGPNYRRATIAITPDLKVSVAVQFGARTVPQVVIRRYDLMSAPGQIQLPPTLKFGFGGSEGGYDNYHDVRNVVVLPTTSTLSISPDIGRPGDSVTLTGVNFGPNETVYVFGAMNFKVPWYIVSTDALGQFSPTVTLPQRAVGYYELTGIGQSRTTGSSALILR
jgi:hypothetical protein